MLQVAAAVIEHGGRILAARRKPGGRFGGLWEFPGGKIEAGERPQDALVREIAEELGLSISVEEPLGIFPYQDGDFSVELHAFRATLLGGAVRLSDHDQSLWATPSELGAFDFSPADLPIVRAITREIRPHAPLEKGGKL